MRCIAGIISIGIIFLHANSAVWCQGQNLGTQSALYDELYEQLVHLAPDQDTLATVNGLTLKRDVATFTLQNGTFYLCTPVGSRVCAAIYLGEGIFSFSPPTEIERQQLYRFYEKDSLWEKFNVLFLLFADSTFEELTRTLSFGKGTLAPDAGSHVKYCLKYLSDEDSRYFDSDFMKTFLEKERNDLFYAHFSFDKTEPLFFQINPFDEEEVSFMQRRTDASGHVREVVNQFHTQQEYLNGLDRRIESKDRIRIHDYVIESVIADDLDFSASASIRFTSLVDNQQWIDMSLYRDLTVDSVFWSSGRPARFFRGEESWTLWVQCERPLHKAQECSLQVYYHGDLLDRDEFAWISIKSPSNWYPRSGYRTEATYDLTFHVPSKLKFASVGEKRSSIEGEELRTTRWVTDKPIRNASFNLGYFKEFKFYDENLPPITVYMSEGGHREIAGELVKREVLSGADMEKQVGADIVNSVGFFQEVYGKIPVQELYATEIPYLHGEAFPGLVHLAWTTYQRTGREGYDEIFRAHEVAHQWWAIGVDFQTYHDQWLSEGFSDYSGLWYMQTILRDNKKFFNMLERWKEQIINNRKSLFGKGQEAGPIWLGYRTQGSKTKGDYGLIIYKKGAWVLHMLRNMFIDLKTMNEDRFKNMMRDFFASHVGRKASTGDFQKIVEKYAGEDMSWFFHQWVYDTKIPEYKFAYRTTKTPEGKFRVACRIQQMNVPKEFKMYVPLLITFDNDRYARVRVLVTGETTELELPLMPMEPEEIIFNDLQSVLCEVDNVGWE